MATVNVTANDKAKEDITVTTPISLISIGLSSIDNTTIVNVTDAVYEDDTTELADEIVVTAIVGLSILTLLGVTGNLMTVFAYFEDRKRNTVYDFFILNLAITDLIISGITIPSNAVYVLTDFSWKLGYWPCKIWLLIELTATVEATLLILVLSFDRLLMISLGALYNQKVTWNTAAKTVLVFSWMIAFSHYGPAIIWEHFIGKAELEYVGYCDVEFVFQFVYAIIMITVEFVVPFGSLVIINALLFYKIVKWSNTRQNAKRSKNVKTPINRATLSSNTPDENTDNIRESEDIVVSVIKVRNSVDILKNSPQQTALRGWSEQIKESSTNRKAKLKSAKFIGALVLTFLLCWLPYEITTFVISVCLQTLYEFFIWLLLFKSVVNPFLYALQSPRYRSCFRRYITLNGRFCRAKSMT